MAPETVKNERDLLGLRRSAEVAERAVKRFCWDKNFPGNERLASIIAEEIEKAQTRPMFPTRGMELANDRIFPHSPGLISFEDKDGNRRTLRLEGDGLGDELEFIRAILMNAVDSERASAVAEYREQLAAKFDRLGNQAAADVVRE